ncbi:LAMI_0A04412g1_1 [Lachancea mirantina]|uniref:tRNA dimethylallyltransferase n=1 Tax=Lachancea mirantina TaxID=1230905 RepID=A0A1G4IPG0_9SACH|nr:LAMI_0A04412g1_1 [Lachancea mirantina]
MLSPLKRALRSFKMPHGKVIVIAGTTGVGKSLLSIQLASHVNGEIINSDSMQVYKDAPIITNKHPVEEREGIVHHIMNHVDWDEDYYLHRFEKECLQAIEDIHARGKTAIIVGGTHYYLQVLFKKRVEEKLRPLTEDERKFLDSEQPELIHAELKKHDAVIAQKFHPNDTRRVRRMLEIFYTTGQKPSNIFAAQNNALIYDTLFFWIYSNPDVLGARLDARVDTMLKSGGLEEIEHLYKIYQEKSYTPDQCQYGIWQVIGFKEFLPWLENRDKIPYEHGLERMKIRTRQYAKRQVKWIRKMLLPDVSEDLYLLDATDLAKWDENVRKRAFEITNSFITGKRSLEPYAPKRLQSQLKLNPEETSSPKATGWEQFSCMKCRDKNAKPLILVGQKNWQIHLQSRRHRTALKNEIKRKNFEKFKNSLNECF